MEDDEATPRGIIRGVLTTGSISESGRSLRPKKTPRASTSKKTPTNPPSRSEVATRLLTRSRSANKRKVSSGSITSTPSDSTTPRTLIAGFLQTAPVAKSVVKGKRQKTVESDTSRTSRSASQAEDNTPRTIIQNFLREALAESPEEPMLSASSDVEDEDIPAQQSDKEENRSSLVTSVAPDDTGTETGEQSVSMTTSHQTDHVTLMEAVTPRLLDSYEDEGAAQNSSNQDPQDEHDSLPSMATDQTLQTDTVIRGNVMQTSRQWRDLVTPRLPLNISSAAASGQLSSSAKSSDVERPFFGGRPPTGKAGAKSSKRPSGPRMPSALVKSIFQHFSKAKLSKEALQAVENGSNLFFKQVSCDLMAYCRHAHRSTIELADVELLMKRQGLITDTQSLHSLVEKYLPLEYRQEIIPTVQAGNKIVLK